MPLADAGGDFLLKKKQKDGIIEENRQIGRQVTNILDEFDIYRFIKNDAPYYANIEVVAKRLE